MYEFQFDDDDYDMYEIIYAENPIKILVDDQFDKKMVAQWTYALLSDERNTVSGKDRMSKAHITVT